MPVKLRKKSNATTAKANALLEQTNQMLAMSRSTLETYHAANQRSHLPNLGASINAWGKDVEGLKESLQKGKKVTKEVSEYVVYSWEDGHEVGYEEAEENLPFNSESVVDGGDSENDDWEDWE